MNFVNEFLVSKVQPVQNVEIATTSLQILLATYIYEYMNELYELIKV